MCQTYQINWRCFLGAWRVPSCAVWLFRSKFWRTWQQRPRTGSTCAAPSHCCSSLLSAGRSLSFCFRRIDCARWSWSLCRAALRSQSLPVWTLQWSCQARSDATLVWDSHSESIAFQCTWFVQSTLHPSNASHFASHQWSTRVALHSQSWGLLGHLFWACYLSERLLKHLHPHLKQYWARHFVAHSCDLSFSFRAIAPLWSLRRCSCRFQLVHWTTRQEELSS